MSIANYSGTITIESKKPCKSRRKQIEKDTREFHRHIRDAIIQVLMEDGWYDYNVNVGFGSTIQVEKGRMGYTKLSRGKN